MSVCSACQGTGKYVGLRDVEDCRDCGGSGTQPRAPRVTIVPGESDFLDGKYCFESIPLSGFKLMPYICILYTLPDDPLNPMSLPRLGSCTDYLDYLANAPITETEEREKYIEGNISEWHALPGDPPELHEWLGMTWEEYSLFVERPHSFSEQVCASNKPDTFRVNARITVSKPLETITVKIDV